MGRRFDCEAGVEAKHARMRNTLSSAPGNHDIESLLGQAVSLSLSLSLSLSRSLALSLSLSRSLNLTFAVHRKRSATCASENHPRSDLKAKTHLMCLWSVDGDGEHTSMSGAFRHVCWWRRILMYGPIVARGWGPAWVCPFRDVDKAPGLGTSSSRQIKGVYLPRQTSRCTNDVVSTGSKTISTLPVAMYQSTALLSSFSLNFERRSTILDAVQTIAMRRRANTISTIPNVEISRSRTTSKPAICIGSVTAMISTDDQLVFHSRRVFTHR